MANNILLAMILDFGDMNSNKRDLNFKNYDLILQGYQFDDTNI